MSTDQALASSQRELSAAPGAIAAPATRFAMFAGSGGMPMPRSAGQDTSDVTPPPLADHSCHNARCEEQQSGFDR